MLPTKTSQRGSFISSVVRILERSLGLQEFLIYCSELRQSDLRVEHDAKSDTFTHSDVNQFYFPPKEKDGKGGNANKK